MNRIATTAETTDQQPDDFFPVTERVPEGTVLTVLDPNALTSEEVEALRDKGFTVPKAEPKPSIWK